MSVVQWVTTAAVKALLHDGEKDGKTRSIAETVDKVLTSWFPDDPRGIKLFFVRHFMIPISKYLLREEPDGWTKAQQKV